MRIPFPVRFPMWGACLFALVLMVVQLIQGTAPFFALCSFTFIMVATATFNLAGGFSRPSGSYIFFFSTLTLIVGLCTKAVLGEAADSNLLVPHTTILVYLVGICAMYCSVFVSRKLVPRKGILQDLVTDKNLQNATVGCLVMGIVVQIIVTIVPKTSGSFISALVQINRFYPMAMILGVIHQVRKSGGTRSINLPVLLAGAAILYLGILGFSKEAMFTPVACWLATVACQNYKLSRVQVVGLAASLTFMFVYLVPYSQYGRDYEVLEDNLESHVKASLYLLSNLDMVRAEYKASRDYEVSEKRGYFNVDVGFLSRLEMVSVDDQLIELTERTGPYGIEPLIQGFQNLVPHFLWHNKPTVTSGNSYAHEIGGIIGDDDDDTGISFSAVGEGYHLAKWGGDLDSRTPSLDHAVHPLRFVMRRRSPGAVGSACRRLLLSYGSRGNAGRHNLHNGLCGIWACRDCSLGGLRYADSRLSHQRPGAHNCCSKCPTGGQRSLAFRHSATDRCGAVSPGLPYTGCQHE